MMNLVNPMWYGRKASALNKAADAYYRPLFRAGSIKPLWHVMAFMSLSMYCVSQYGIKRGKILDRRKHEDLAMKEYIAKHGDPNAH
mmetsp:Transcript_9028/g.10343  ORF Transcript_9028/g.10343 Transcript_9028/m.10343 type:complete len:86 (-) Transcript_9028:118-375(-)|eukprot:CAMPEP_0194140336 /NCGR_PEP_ID=MMETSP0152-20130528/9894_1 /TAXON_ID=1049557 /ORGANISM="Thalassiothrix antarctica, Strain L6-D1" /LENGTH=85 /DNA_ID=CAMNT_0038838545 /DNA_START=110 /DNA_END=367 /DNA_ORIENTATION=-